MTMAIKWSIYLLSYTLGLPRCGGNYCNNMNFSRHSEFVGEVFVVVLLRIRREVFKNGDVSLGLSKNKKKRKRIERDPVALYSLWLTFRR